MDPLSNNNDCSGSTSSCCGEKDAAPETKAGNATVKLDGADVAVQTKNIAGSSVIGFANDFKIAAGQTLQIEIN